MEQNAECEKIKTITVANFLKFRIILQIKTLEGDHIF